MLGIAGQTGNQILLCKNSTLPLDNLSVFTYTNVYAEGD